MTIKTLTRLLLWALGSFVQYTTTYIGIEQGRGGYLAIGLLFTWLAITGVFFLAISFPAVVKTYARQRTRMDLGDSPVPWSLDLVLDTCFTLYLLSSGWLITGIAYAMHTFLLIPLRRASKDYNNGLVQLVTTGVTTWYPGDRKE